VTKRDQRKDGFARTIAKAMGATVAADGDEATKFLTQHGISRSLVKQAIVKIAESRQPFTLWTLVDTLTGISG
jgi:hypothetical protein